MSAPSDGLFLAGRLRRLTLAAALGLILLGGGRAGPVEAADRDPALAPAPEELDARADRWQQRRRTGAAVLLGSLAVASVLIGWARHRARRGRRPEGRSTDSVDNPPLRPPR